MCINIAITITTYQECSTNQENTETKLKLCSKPSLPCGTFIQGRPTFSQKCLQLWLTERRSDRVVPSKR